MDDIKKLFNRAKQVSANAYAPYSKFKVGAAILYESGEVYIGANVENSSYGLSLCAERNALSNALASGEKSKLIAIAIYSPNTKKCTPCGACRQWLWEFEYGQNIKIILEDDNDKLFITDIQTLLPMGFSL